MSDIPPEVMEELIAQYMAEQEGGLAPIETGEFPGAMPQLDLEGDPYTLTSQLNQTQDVTDLMTDPMFAAIFGGPGALDARQFQPTVRYEQVESPEYVRWQNYLNSPTSFEGMVAAELESGGTPYSAIRRIRAKALENPDGALFQELSAMYPEQDNAGSVPGTIDWGLISQAATDIDEMRAAIPQIGNSGSITMPDGTVIQGAGEILEQVDPNTGRPMLVRRIEEPTELMEKFDELGYPYPTEQYSPEMFLGPEWSQARDELETQRPIYGEMEQAWRDALADVQNYQPQDYSDQMATRDQADVGPGTNTVGTTDVPLAGNEAGVPEYQAERGIWGTGTVPGIGTEAPVSIQEFDQIQSPTEWLEFYNAHANELSDDERMEVIGNLMSRGGPSAQGGQWDMVLDQVANDMGVETPTGGGFEDISLPDIGRDENPIVTQATAITNPEEYRAFIQQHLGELRPSDMADLGERATTMGMTIATGGDMDAWSTLAGDLLSGDFAPGLPEGELPTTEGGPAGQSIGVTELMRRHEEKYGTSEKVTGDSLKEWLAQNGGEPPIGPPAPGRDQPGPFPDNYPRDVSGYNFIQSPDDMALVAQILGQQPESPGPDYATSGSNYRQQQADAEREAMLRMVLPGNDQRTMNQPTGQPGPERPRAAIPGGTPPYVYSGSTEGPGPERPRAATPGGTPPYVYSGGGEQEPMTAAMIAQIIGGGGSAPRRTGERTAEEREEQAGEQAPRNLTPGSVLTGEERRSNAEREELARQNAPQGSVDIFGNGDYSGRRGKFRRGVLAANEERVRFGLARQQVYGRAWGEALRAAYEAQMAGVTPFQQTAAQRMQGIQGSGIPLLAPPRVVDY